MLKEGKSKKRKKGKKRNRNIWRLFDKEDEKETEIHLFSNMSAIKIFS